jgi:heme-degrading monooxygenase HmoA
MYYAVIFTSTRTEIEAGYTEMAQQMVELAKTQTGSMGVESARNEIGITVSYWESIEAIQNWKANMEHLEAQKNGRTTWYKNYKVRIAKVEREYEF